MTANPMSENVARDVADAGELMHHIANQKYVSDKAPKKKNTRKPHARTHDILYIEYLLTHNHNNTMANKQPLKTTFDVNRVIRPIFTGGSVAIDNSARILATVLGEDAILTDPTNGKHLAQIEGVRTTCKSH